MLRINTASLSLAIAALLLSVNSVQAGIYKWVDAEGQVHYTQDPPPGQDAEQMRGISTDYVPPPPKKSAEPATKDRNAKAEPEAKDEKTYTPEQQKTLCANAKKDLQTLAQSGRLRVKQQDGSTNVMTDKERNDREKTMKEMVNKHCK